METFKSVLSVAFNILQINLNVFGYSVTFWQILVFFVLASVALSLFYGMMR